MERVGSCTSLRFHTARVVVRKETVDPSRSERFRAVLAESASTARSTLTAICLDIVKLLPVRGAAVALMGGGSMQGIACATDSATKAIQDLEFTLGEGPGLDAFAQSQPVFIDELAPVILRWPFFVPAAMALEVGSLYSLPLSSGNLRVGVLSLWSDQASALQSVQKDDALVAAELVTELVLTMQKEESSESLAWPLDVSDHRVAVHQASGMVSAQLNCGVEEALVCLRAFAFSTGVQIDEIAKQVIGRELRFD
jgi:hypothetical protein